MQMTSFKLLGATALTLAFATGTAFAGDGKDCDHKKKASMKTQAAMTTTATQTSVLSATERAEKKMDGKVKMTKKVYSFEDALTLCQKKGVNDLQACIDYKTGKVDVKGQG